MSKEFSAGSLDVKRFAEEGATLAGEEALERFPRLMAETQQAGADSRVGWSAKGDLRNPGHVQPEIWLHLKAQARLVLTCQRCLGPVEVPVGVDRPFRFVSDEDAAAAQDEQSDEDVLALSRNFDLPGLIEDEMLMALPLAPMHETCPVPVKLAVADDDFEDAAPERENPFAILGRFKPGKS